MNRGNVQFLLLHVSIVIGKLSIYISIEIYKQNLWSNSDRLLNLHEISALSVYVNGSKMKVRPSLMDGEDESKLDNFLYVVNNARDQPCILANVSINFTIPYEKARINNTKSIDRKKKLTRTISIPRRIKLSMFQTMLRYKAIVHP